MNPNNRFPSTWISLVYGAVVWVPVVLSLVENLRDGITEGWSGLGWFTTLIIWAVGCFVWMCLCDWAMVRLGRARGWWA